MIAGRIAPVGSHRRSRIMSAQFETGSEHLHYQVDDGVAVITMDRPERRNALTGDMLAGLGASLAVAETDESVRCVVLTGAGGAFCAGGDVKGFAEGGGAGAGGFSSWDAGVHGQRLSHRDTSARLFEMPKPTLAVLPGPAAGAGLSLALACDLRIAVDTAVITTAFAKVGLAGDYGGTWFLTQLVGPARAKELYFLSERIDMATALELGIVNRVASADDFEAAWRSLAAQLAAGPPIAYRYMKENINRSVDGDLRTVLDLESTHHRHTGTTRDHIDASKAFVEKRQPVFEGR
jgi:2-(1,2-epoxy-1,2-dihydrophenyl)acetyl-CoA isomerase